MEQGFVRKTFCEIEDAQEAYDFAVQYMIDVGCVLMFGKYYQEMIFEDGCNILVPEEEMEMFDKACAKAVQAIEKKKLN